MMMICAIPLIQFNKFIYVRQQTVVNMGLIVLPLYIDNLMCFSSTEEAMENHQLARQ